MNVGGNCMNINYDPAQGGTNIAAVLQYYGRWFQVNQ